MALKTTPYDSAEYLRTEEERAAYMAACMEDAPADAAFITHALGVVARSRNMIHLAVDTGLTRGDLYQAPSHSANPHSRTTMPGVLAFAYRLPVDHLRPA